MILHNLSVRRTPVQPSIEIAVHFIKKCTVNKTKLKYVRAGVKPISKLFTINVLFNICKNDRSFSIEIEKNVIKM